MKKQIGCILCLCTVLMSGCSKEQSYQNLLNERIADALETSEDQLKEIYEAVVKAAPEYDLEKIKGELKIKKR